MMNRLLQILEGVAWAAAGIVLNLAGAFVSLRFFVPGIVWSVCGLFTMTLGLSSRWREPQGILGCERDRATVQGFRVLCGAALLISLSRLAELAGLQVSTALDLVFLILGAAGAIYGAILIGRQMRR